MTDFPKVSAGTPSDKSPTTSASWVNAVSDVAQDFQLRKAAGEAATGRGLTNSSGLVSVKNLTGSDLLRGAYVQLGDYLQTAVGHRRPIFEGNLYDVAEDGRIAILTKAAKQNIFEDARTIGVCTARINITDTGHRFAAPSDGLSILQSAASGNVEILSTNKISGTGEQELTVLIGGGSSTSNVTSFAVVTSGAGASTHGSSGVTFGTTGECVLLLDDGSKSVSDPLEFKSLHRVAIPVDAIIQLSAPEPIEPGSEWADNPVVGRFIDAVDELAQLTGFAAQTSLSLPEDGTTAEDIEWLGGECEE